MTPYMKSKKAAQLKKDAVQAAPVKKDAVQVFDIQADKIVTDKIIEDIIAYLEKIVTPNSAHYEATKIEITKLREYLK
jgi:hypothetical protein